MTNKQFETLDGINSVGPVIVSNTVTISSNLDVDSLTLFVDSTLNSVGVGKLPDPAFKLDVDGNLRATYLHGDGFAISNVQISTSQITNQSTLLRSNVNDDFDSAGQASAQTLGIANNSVLRVKSGSLYLNTEQRLYFGTGGELSFHTNGTHTFVTGQPIEFSHEVKALSFNSSSDINLKTNVKSINNALEKVKKISGVTFDWKRDNKQSAGVIAQEIREVLPEAVIESSNGLSVNYNAIIALLIEAIKELESK